MKIFQPHESYLIRHKILEFLFIKSNEEVNYQDPESEYTAEEISDYTGIEKEKITLYHEFLHEVGEVHCCICENVKCKHHMKITLAGRQAYIHRKYLKEKETEKRNLIKDYSAILSPLVSVLSLIVAIVVATKSCAKSRPENKVELYIERELPKLKITPIKKEQNLKTFQKKV